MSDDAWGQTNVFQRSQEKWVHMVFSMLFVSMSVGVPPLWVVLETA